MNNRVNCIMLVDDNKIDNFFHERVIKKNDAAETIVAKDCALSALDCLKKGETDPDVIFLDINMPGMNGWEFIKEYKKLGGTFLHKMIVVFINDYDDPDDEALETTKGVFAEFRPKPLTKEMLNEVLEKYSNSKAAFS